MPNEYTTCPRCHEETLLTAPGRNALSRRDNDTLICSDCGNEEAFIDCGLMEMTDNEYNFRMSLVAAGKVKE